MRASEKAVVSVFKFLRSWRTRAGMPPMGRATEGRCPSDSGRVNREGPVVDMLTLESRLLRDNLVESVEDGGLDGLDRCKNGFAVGLAECRSGLCVSDTLLHGGVEGDCRVMDGLV